MFDHYLDHWNLEIDGDPIVTQFSRLLPVRFGGVPAMLKLLLNDEERSGSDLLAWWDGAGAVRVLAREEDGLLLERAVGLRSLTRMAISGEDDEATRILCQVAATLHAPRPSPPPPHVPTLVRWFAALEPAAREYGGLLAIAHAHAEPLLRSQQEVTILHGDLHHENVLDGAARGWLAIDPKGIVGERTFDYVNILRNPLNHFGADRARLERQIGVISDAANLAPNRLVAWTIAFCGLSAAWALSDPVATERGMGEAQNDLDLCQAAIALLEAMSPR